MKFGPSLAAGVAAGYVLGRTKKMRLAITLAAVGITGKFGVRPSELVLRGMKELANSDVGKAVGSARGEVGALVRDVATESARGRIDQLSQRLTTGLGGVGQREEPQEPEEEEDDELENGEDESTSERSTRRRPVARRSSSRRRADDDELENEDEEDEEEEDDEEDEDELVDEESEPEEEDEEEEPPRRRARPASRRPTRAPASSGARSRR